MPNRRTLSLWFPRLGAERLMRMGHGLDDIPLAIVAEERNAQVISSLNQQGEAAGLYIGQPLRDAHAMCANLLTKSRNIPAETQFLMALRRWAGKF